MNELKIEKFGDGRCAECGKEKPGVRIGLPFVGDTAFLCWEHYRLLQESLKPQRVVHEVVRIVERRPCCCHPCCDCFRGRTYSRESYAGCRVESGTFGRSESRGETVSQSWAHGGSWSHSEGSSHSRETTSSSNGGPLP